MRFWNYSPDYSLNCTLFGPVTITNHHHHQNCFTNWDDYKSNWIATNQIKINMLVFGERRKSEFPGKILFKQSREPTNSTQIWRQVGELIPGHIGGGWMLSPQCQPCSPFTFCSIFTFYLITSIWQTLKKQKKMHVLIGIRIEFLNLPNQNYWAKCVYDSQLKKGGKIRSGWCNFVCI